MVCNVVQPHKSGQEMMFEAYLLPINQNRKPIKSDLEALRIAPLLREGT